jgi:hypothetical protein
MIASLVKLDKKVKRDARKKENRVLNYEGMPITLALLRRPFST